MQYGYVVVIEADSEPDARSYAERCLQPGGGTCHMVGGGTSISKSRKPYRSGLVAAAIAQDAYGLDGEGGEVERLANALHAEAIK